MVDRLVERTAPAPAEPFEVGHLLQVVHRADRDERVSFFFSALRWRGEPRNLEPHKADDFRWFPLDHLPDNMVPYVRAAIERWRAGVLYGESGWDARRADPK